MFSLAERDLEVDVVRAVVKTCLIVVGVRVGGGALTMDEVDVLRADQQPSTTLLWPDGWGGAAELDARLLHLVTTHAKGRGVIPLLAPRQTLHRSSVLYHAEVTDITLSSRT